MMRVTIKLFASFRAGRFTSEVRDYTEPVTPGDIAKELGIQPKSVGVMLRNGIQSTLDDQLLDGDQLSLIPRISGG